MGSNRQKFQPPANFSQFKHCSSSLNKTVSLRLKGHETNWRIDEIGPLICTIQAVTESIKFASQQLLYSMSFVTADAAACLLLISRVNPSPEIERCASVADVPTERSRRLTSQASLLLPLPILSSTCCVRSHWAHSLHMELDWIIALSMRISMFCTTSLTWGTRYKLS